MKRFVRITMYSIIFVVTLFVLAYTSLYFYKEKRNAIAEDMINEAIKEINDFKDKNGRYPESFMDLPIAEKSKQKVLFIFPLSKIYYHKDNDAYRVSYHIFPFGPFHGYDKKNDEWFYEE